MRTKKAVLHKDSEIKHLDGPFKGFAAGDVVRVIYHGAQASLMQLTQVKRHALEGMDGSTKCRITMVSPTDLRFYAAPNRQTVLRPIILHMAAKGVGE